jgi:hypothetical protein
MLFSLHSKLLLPAHIGKGYSHPFLLIVRAFCIVLVSLLTQCLLCLSVYSSQVNCAQYADTKTGKGEDFGNSYWNACSLRDDIDIAVL